MPEVPEWVLNGKSRITESGPPPHGERSGKSKPPPLAPIMLPELQNRPVPKRRWIVEGAVPVGNVTLLSGDGGVGKSLLAQQLLTCVTLGRPWLGMATEECTAVGIFCEDDADELHIRQAKINDHYGCSFADLRGAIWLPRVGEDSVMMHFPDRGAAEKRPFYGQIRELIGDTGARLVICDALHDLFSGNENFRSNARQFVTGLRSMVLHVDGAVLLLSHPSMAGLNTGTGMSGSTAWNNASDRAST